MQSNQEPTVPLANVLDTRRPQIDDTKVRPDGWLPASPDPTTPQPVDNAGVPPVLLADNPASMDDVMDGMGVFAHPYSFESDHPRGHKPTGGV